MPIKKGKPKSKLKATLKKKMIKKLVKAPRGTIVKIEGKLVGKISHYFSDISVGVIEMSGGLDKGDEIRIVGGEATDFNQTVNSMQVEHQEVQKAKKGDSVGLKVKEKVREGYRVYKV